MHLPREMIVESAASDWQTYRESERHEWYMVCRPALPSAPTVHPGNRSTPRCVEKHPRLSDRFPQLRQRHPGPLHVCTHRRGTCILQKILDAYKHASDLKDVPGWRREGIPQHNFDRVSFQVCSCAAYIEATIEINIFPNLRHRQVEVVIDNGGWVYEQKDSSSAHATPTSVLRTSQTPAVQSAG
jgi:hypothetical protein